MIVLTTTREYTVMATPSYLTLTHLTLSRLLLDVNENIRRLKHTVSLVGTFHPAYISHQQTILDLHQCDKNSIVYAMEVRTLETTLKALIVRIMQLEAVKWSDVNFDQGLYSELCDRFGNTLDKYADICDNNPAIKPVVNY